MMTQQRKRFADAPEGFLQLVRTHYAVAAATERQIGVHYARWRVLFVLYRDGTCTQKHLADYFKVNAGTVTRMLQDLEKKGYVSRERDSEDNRRARVTLTPAGEKLVRDGLPRRDALVSIALRGFDEAAQQRLAADLRMIERNLVEAGLVPGAA